MATQSINSSSEILENQGILYKVIGSETKLTACRTQDSDTMLPKISLCKIRVQNRSSSMQAEIRNIPA